MSLEVEHYVNGKRVQPRDLCSPDGFRNFAMHLPGVPEVWREREDRQRVYWTTTKPEGNQ